MMERSTLLSTMVKTINTDQRLLAPACNYMKTGFEIRPCTALSPHVRKNSFYKLICVIKMLMRTS